MVPQLLDSPYQWIILLVIVLIVFGSTKLAGLGKATGQAIREFRDEVVPDKKDAKETADQTP